MTVVVAEIGKWGAAMSNWWRQRLLSIDVVMAAQQRILCCLGEREVHIKDTMSHIYVSVGFALQENKKFVDHSSH